MKGFSVGDVCEIVFHPAMVATDLDCVGLEVVITGLTERFSPVSGARLYAVSGLPARKTGHASEAILRLKRPPNKDEFTAGEWELIPWNPYKAKERVT